ncbi:MAG: NAD(P)(+) transhydrogenase (Re/Si-specific) subunit beta [Myxococcales bacterium]|nr:NAD(P)(+) transhydrogenase (Re/Si-specific) subunit beta [Myxococcales bacterium]
MNTEFLSTAVAPLVYIASTMLFVFGLKGMTKVKSARRGNHLAAAGMFLAVVGALLELGLVDYRWIAIGLIVGAVVGAFLAIRVQMTEMPEMVALLNGFGGAASALVALSVVWNDVVEKDAAETMAHTLRGGAADAVTIALSILIGSITLTGSVVAMLKLKGKLKKGQPILLPGRHGINLVLGLGAIGLTAYAGFVATGAEGVTLATLGLTGVALLLGVLLVIPIGGADMPVVVSLLNSYSGVAASMAGFVVGNPLLIVAGATVGAAGLILTQIMCVAMNRSLLNVLVGGFGATDGGGGAGDQVMEYHNVRSCGAEEAAMVLEAAESVIIVPGYGLAVAQAQHTVRELASELEKRGARVTYAIHPVAGRMPGHMNVLLAEADVPHEQLIEMDLINSEFKNTDAVIVVGANDVVNPVANKDPGSPIYGMPILNAHEAKSVFVIKRSLGAGYAGIKNELFEMPNTMMIYGDAKKVLQDLVREVKDL